MQSRNVLHMVKALQVDVGGGLPNCLTIHAISDAVKKRFAHGEGYFKSEDIEFFLKSEEEHKQLNDDINLMSSAQSDFVERQRKPIFTVEAYFYFVYLR